MVRPQKPKRRRNKKKPCIGLRRKRQRVMIQSVAAQAPILFPLLSDLNPSLDGPTIAPSLPPTEISSYSIPPKPCSVIVPFVPQPLSLGPKRKRLNFDEQQNMRIAIAFLFERVYYNDYSPDNLNQIVRSISQTLNISSHCTVKRVVLDKKQSLDSSIVYKHCRKQYEKEQLWKVVQGTFEEHLLTLWIERGSSFNTATKVYNAKFRAKFNLPRVGVHAIYNAMKRAKHISESTASIPQTNQNNIIHRQARYNWMCQLLVRMGEKIPSPQNEEESEYRKRLDDDMVNRDRLENENLTFVPEQVAYWDEIHIYQVVGSHRKRHIIFARDEHGIYKKDGSFDYAKRKVSFMNYNSVIIYQINQLTHTYLK